MKTDNVERLANRILNYEFDLVKEYVDRYRTLRLQRATDIVVISVEVERVYIWDISEEETKASFGHVKNDRSLNVAIDTALNVHDPLKEVMNKNIKDFVDEFTTFIKDQSIEHNIHITKKDSKKVMKIIIAAID